MKHHSWAGLLVQEAMRSAHEAQDLVAEVGRPSEALQDGHRMGKDEVSRIILMFFQCFFKLFRAIYSIFISKWP